MFDPYNDTYLLITPYQLTKFQTPSTNFADKVEMPFAKGHNSRKNWQNFFKS